MPSQKHKNLPVAVLSTADPWSTLPINRAQLWPLTWPPSPVCCRLTSASEQQREEITCDTDSARCPKPRFPLPHAAAPPEEGKVHRLVLLGFRFFECRGEASFASPHCFPNRHKVIFRSKTCKCFLVCNDVLLHFSFPWIGRCFA